MDHKASESAKIFADFTLGRIDPAVKNSLTQEQLTELRRALIAQQESSKHRIDLRFTVNFLFSKYYFVILGGKDRRRKTIEKNKLRKEGWKEKIVTTILTVLITVSMIYSFIYGIKMLYEIKKDMGIDIFSNLHADDIVNKIIDMVF